MFIVAHEDDCDLRPRTGITVDIAIMEHRQVWEPCSCGGRKVQLTYHNTGADIPHYTIPTAIR